MITLMLISLSLVVLLISITLLKSYKNISVKELKRQARAGDKLAENLYVVASYGYGLDAFLWFVIGLSGGLLFVLLANVIVSWLAALLIAVTIWVAFAWLPITHGTRVARSIAIYASKPLQKILELIRPVIAAAERFIEQHRPITIHTGLYTREDLIDVLNQQKGQLDNRISKEDLVIARNALSFGEKSVKEIMIPRRAIKSVNITESVGPILMGELHKSGHSRFPVYEGKKDNFVGIVYMRDMLKSRAGGLVKNLLENKTYYVHDESKLSEVLQAFIKTHHHMFLVVNSFEEIIGLVTLEDVLEQIIGKPIIDEFDQFDDIRAVAKKYAAKEHKDNTEAVKSSPKPSEVVE